LLIILVCSEVDSLRILKWQFETFPDDELGLNESRGYACEFVAWQFLTSLSRRETIVFLLQELPDPRRGSVTDSEAERGSSGFAGPALENDRLPRPSDERSPLLSDPAPDLSRTFGAIHRDNPALSRAGGTESTVGEAFTDEQYSLFYGLNALEIAAIAHAKKFLSQNVVQKIIDDIWKGEIVFWDSLSLHAKKTPHILNKR
jgi:hypothetical protein